MKLLMNTVLSEIDESKDLADAKARMLELDFLIKNAGLIKNSGTITARAHNPA